LALPNVDARRTVYAIGALFIITSTWFVLCMPKLYLAIFRSADNISLNNGGTTGSGGKNSNSGGKNSHESSQRRMSMGKSSYQLQKSKVSGTTTPTRSKAGSTVHTAPGSPMMANHKLSLNLGAPRSSVSTAVSGSPAMMHIPRHLSVAHGTPKTRVVDDIKLDIPALDLTTLQANAGGRRASQPQLYDPNSTHTPSHGSSGKYTPAKNFV